MKKSTLIPIALSALIFVPMLFIHSCANTTQAPSGGPRDTIPPKVVAAFPDPGSVNVPLKGTRIVLTFNEYVTLKNAANILLSPPQSKMLKTKVKGKSVIIDFEEELKPNTTYTIDFTEAIADNNEGNFLPGFSYVFSTGDQIDSMFLTGTVVDSKKLDPVKGATVMLYKDQADSAVFLRKPYAVVRTDDWGYFCIPFIQDTTYRLYAIKDANNNSLYDKETELIAFNNTTVRPLYKVNDTIPEMQKYDMKDTLSCQSRRSEYELVLFREKPDKQYIVNTVRVSPRMSYITFNAPNAWIDSLWIAGYPADRVITQFNREQDSLEIWLNDRRPAPDSLHLFVSYRKTDSLNVLHAFLEHVPLLQRTKDGKPLPKTRKKNYNHEDTTCVYEFQAEPTNIEQDGLAIEFKNPIIEEHFKDIEFKYTNPKQQEFSAEMDITRDSTNIRRYIMRPKVKFQKGYDYSIKIPHRAFRDINGFYSDSLVKKLTLPTDENLSTLILEVKGVDKKYVVELLNEKRDNVLRTYVIDSDSSLSFPYLKEGSYAIRFTEDGNRNSIVDTGSLLEHRQPEKVRFFEFEGVKLIVIPASSEVSQQIDLNELFND